MRSAARGMGALYTLRAAEERASRPTSSAASPCQPPSPGNPRPVDLKKYRPSGILMGGFDRQAHSDERTAAYRRAHAERLQSHVEALHGRPS